MRIPRADLGLEQQSDEAMEWYRAAKFGMFIHWGVYAGPAQGEWYMHNAAISPEHYRVYTTPEAGDQQFTADDYDPASWARLAKDAGARYTVLTARHHDGFALFDSAHPNAWTSVQEPGIRRDLVAAYVDAVRAAGLRVGLYYSPINWRYPGYYDVTGTSAAPNPWGYTTAAWHKDNARIMKEEVYEHVGKLTTKYGHLDLLWWDGGWLGEQGTDAAAAYFWEPGYVRSTANAWPVGTFGQTEPGTGAPLGLMGMVRRNQPSALVTPRSGWLGDYEVDEGGSIPSGGLRVDRVREKVATIGGTWGYCASCGVMSYDDALGLVVNSVVRDMTVMLNVGPDRHGRIPANQAALMRRIGMYMEAVGESIYGTRGGPWDPVDGQVGFTYRDQTLYAHVLPGASGASYTTPSLGDARVVRVYDAWSKANLPYTVSADNRVTASGLDRARHPQDTVIAFALDRTVLPDDIARGRPTASDSVESAKGNVAANATDGSTSRRWCAADGNTGHWLRVDLGASRPLTGARIAWEFAGHAYKYRIEGSDDGATWSTLADRTSSTDTNQVRVDRFSARARYVRVTVTGLDAGTWASIRELELYDRPFTG